MVKTIHFIYLICISINPQQDAGHLESQVNVLADGLAVSLLHEPLPDPSEPHIRGLLTRLEVCLLRMGGALTHLNHSRPILTFCQNEHCH